MIRVVLLIPTLDRSGAEKQLTLLATRLPRDEFDVHVVALTRGGPYAEVLRQAGVPVTVLGKRFKFDPRTLWQLRRLIQRLNPDILHTWLFTANAYARLVTGDAPRPKVIVSERCVDSWKAGWQLWLDRKQIPRTARLVGNSQGVAEFYREQGFPAERIAVIPNAIDVPEREPIDRAAGLAEFDVPADANVVGSIGRLARQKRMDDLIWAAETLRQICPRLYFLLVGDGPERERLLQFARDIHCEPRMRFLGHRGDAARLLRLMDVFWLASGFEGMSNSLMEAMAAGLPVIASDIPANRELVIHNVNGYLVPVGDRVAYIQYADRLFQDSDLRHRLGEAGRERIRREFSIERMAAAYARLYREIAAET